MNNAPETDSLQRQNRVTNAMREQFHNEGYFVMERCVPEEHLELLRQNCQFFIDKQNAEMDATGTENIGLSHRNKRYFVSQCYEQRLEIGEFLFSELMADICQSTIDDTSYLFWDQYVVKCADKDSKFSWHQDSGYVHIDCPEYLTCWITLDDVTEENGTVYLLPYSDIGIKTVVKHIKDPVSKDLVGYFGKQRGTAVIVPAGSIAVFSSYVFHSSGANKTDKMRRVFLAQYSPVIIRNMDNTADWGNSKPFMKDGRIIA